VLPVLTLAKTAMTFFTNFSVAAEHNIPAQAAEERNSSTRTCPVRFYIGPRTM
jgi:hypothetical protein